MQLKIFSDQKEYLKRDPKAGESEVTKIERIMCYLLDPDMIPVMLPKTLKVERPKEQTGFDYYNDGEYSDGEKREIEENLRRESTVSRKQSIKKSETNSVIF